VAGLVGARLESCTRDVACLDCAGFSGCDASFTFDVCWGN